MASKEETTEVVRNVLRRAVSSADWTDEIADKFADEIIGSVLNGVEYKPKNPTPPVGLGYQRGVPNGGHAVIPHPYKEATIVNSWDGEAKPAIGFLAQSEPQDADAYRTQRSTISKSQGYTGDVCTICGNYTIKLTGHCRTCDTCGANDGCA